MCSSHIIFPHYLPQYIPVEEEACLFELLCLLTTFQCGFPTLGVVLVSGEGGSCGGWAWGNSLLDFVTIFGA